MEERRLRLAQSVEDILAYAGNNAALSLEVERLREELRYANDSLKSSKAEIVGMKAELVHSHAEAISTRRRLEEDNKELASKLIIIDKEKMDLQELLQRSD